MEQAVLFTNYSDEDFSHTWGKVKYSFPKKQSIMLEEGLARHFAKHLSVRELNRRDKNTGGGALSMEMEKALSSTIIEAQDKTQLRQEIINANTSKEDVVKEATDKGMKVDGRKSVETIKKELNEFEGLKKE